MWYSRTLGFLIFFFSLSSCTALQVGPDFYQGLIKRQDNETANAIAHFENALDSSNAPLAAAAVAELLSLHYAGHDLSAATMERIRHRAADPWAAALEMLESPPQGAILTLILDNPNRSIDESALYALQRHREIQTLTTAEEAAVSGRIADSRFRYGEALASFRVTLEESPEIFFRYPALLSALGRSFQFTATGREGLELFVEWEGNLHAYPAMHEAIPPGSENAVRYRLLFFAARIARQRGEATIELFEQALSLALSLDSEDRDEQIDACIWYILHASLAQEPDRTLYYLEKYISLWRDDRYFFDVLDRFTRQLVSGRQWDNVIKLFSSVKDWPFTVTAQTAWIIGRAIEENLFSPENISQAAAVLSADPAQTYIHIAHETAITSTVFAATLPRNLAALYYHTISAQALDKPFILPTGTAAQSRLELSDTAQFLLGFFNNNAVSFAPRHIRAMGSSLPPAEQRLIAEALDTAGLYQESMRLVSQYTRVEGHQITRRDMELAYPRPFKDLIEHHARENDIEPAVMFALIRTESAFNPQAVSHAGAIGLTQLMPSTADEVAQRIRRQGGPDFFTGSPDDDSLDLRDPAVNIHIGASYLANLTSRTDDPLLALLAYNGGINRIRRWHSATPLPIDLFLETVEFPETRNYGRTLTAVTEVYKLLYYNNTGKL